MPGIQNFEAFIIASVLLNLVPGPDTFYVLGRSLAQGRRVGLASTLGVSGGAVCHTLAAAVGLSALIMASATAFLVLKLLGAAYLVYLGSRMLITRKDAVGASSSFTGGGFWSVFKQGLITNAFNPKVALFFLAFLPQFIATDTPSHFLSFLTLGLTFVVTSTLWGLVLAHAAAAISQTLRARPQTLRYLNRFTGTLLVALGIRLAVDQS